MSPYLTLSTFIPRDTTTKYEINQKIMIEPQKPRNSRPNIPESSPRPLFPTNDQERERILPQVQIHHYTPSEAAPVIFILLFL